MLIEPMHINNDAAFTKENNIKDGKSEDKVFNVLKNEPEPLLSTEEEDVCPTCFEGMFVYSAPGFTYILLNQENMEKLQPHF